MADGDLVVVSRLSMSFHSVIDHSLSSFVDLGDGDVRELIVRRFFLVQNAGQQLVRFDFAEDFSPLTQRAISRDLVMLDRLAAADDRGDVWRTLTSRLFSSRSWCREHAMVRITSSSA